MPDNDRQEQLTLKDQLSNILEEGRMVVPGIQALFGFQLIAVFSEAFQNLPDADKTVHLVAILMTVLATSLALAPAAFHRQAEPDCVSERLVNLLTKLLTFAMQPLAVGIALDTYVIVHKLRGNDSLAVIIAVAVWLNLMGFWFIWPSMLRQKRTR